eukprot:scaffold2702_cov116-Isochrysis_galbana.AAC.8
MIFDELSARNISSSVLIFVGGQLFSPYLTPSCRSRRSYSPAPPAGEEGPGSGWIHWLTNAVGTSFKELILPPYHRATSVLQRSVCNTRPSSSIRDDRSNALGETVKGGGERAGAMLVCQRKVKKNL